MRKRFPTFNNRITTLIIQVKSKAENYKNQDY